MRPSRAVSLALLLAMSLVAAAHAGRPAGQNAQVRTSFRMERTTVGLHRPFVLEFSVRNGLSGPVAMDLGPDFTAAFGLELTGPNGETVSTTAAPRFTGPDIGYSPGRVTVQAGGSYRQNLILDRWLDFGIPGAYRLTVRLPACIRLPDGTNLPERKTEFLLNVTPRDPAVLRRFCVRLARTAQSRSSPKAAREAELELSYVDDPVAIPYLAGLARVRNHLEPAVIGALERIGTDAAVDAIISALPSPSEDARIAARQALARIDRRTADPALKRKIARALSGPRSRLGPRALPCST